MSDDIESDWISADDPVFAHLSTLTNQELYARMFRARQIRDLDTVAKINAILEAREPLPEKVVVPESPLPSEGKGADKRRFKVEEVCGRAALEKLLNEDDHRGFPWAVSHILAANIGDGLVYTVVFDNVAVA